MKYRKLRDFDVPVSELCFGTMRYADTDGTANEKSAAGARALETAIDRGVNFIHSSHEYGTRWLTGSVTKEHPRRTDLHHIIKVNNPDWGEPRFSRDSFRRQIENALRELSTERIAVVQHLQRGVTRKEIMTAVGDEHRLTQFDEVTTELAEITQQLRSEGKIAAVMSFPYTPAYARRAVEPDVYSGLVAYFNPLETEMYEFFPRLREQNKDFIAIRPLAGGILTDRRVDRAGLPADDRMREAKMDEAYQQLEAIKPTLTRGSLTWEQFAFRFSLADPIVKSTVLGINTVDHLATAGAEVDVPSALVEKVWEINRRRDEL